ncbi:MAG: isoleucine--tRNA ligase [Gemmatimonadales bacterium]|nr:isoleucine--tRNA ligase [Gemmatimonadales bacterium]
MTFPRWPDLPPAGLEEQVLQQWTAEDLFHETQRRAVGAESFVFYEGPPTANGRPGIHHVFSRTIKDLVCRFHAMRGKQVTRIAGWDAHGLPVEIEVEKQLNLNGKQEIEVFGVEKFNALCRESVFTYQSEWERLSDRIAFWLDYEHPYVTCSNAYIETVWWLLARLHSRGLLARGHRVLPYCPRCGTVLSSHELALGYEDVATRSVYIKLPLLDDPTRKLLVWTTTPWTLISNVAVAVNPVLTYGEYAVGNERLILATERAGAIPLGTNVTGELEPNATFADLPADRVTTFRGKELIGKRYTRPFDGVALSDEKVAEVVVPGAFVSAEDGSGLVHLAPAFGADDYAAGREHGLAFVNPVAGDGTFHGTEWSELEGRQVTAKETNELIIKRLKDSGLWHLTETYEHAYPHCWRCRSPLIYYARDSWFVRTSAVKDRLLELNASIGWHPPEVGTGRFGAWLENNVDWALSRDRYWGTPLPVWVCDADPEHVEVVGSYQHLAERWGRELAPDFDPHKPFIDDVTWACTCGGTMHRTPEVIDTWFDSGAMPYAQWHYPFEHETDFDEHFPADFICEGIDQTRGWFYSLLAIAVTAFDQAPYRNVIVNELVLDSEGQKMSKSRGNVIEPWDVIQEFGADTVRVYLIASSQVWLPKRFDQRTIPEVAGGFFETLKHTYTFFALYAGEWTPTHAPSERPVVDRWLLGRLAATVDAVTRSWLAYDVTTGMRTLMDFVVDDLSNWYVRVNRDRFWAPDTSADPRALATLYQALVTISRLLAPAAPFVSDWLHRALVGQSVHLASFPVPDHESDPALETAMTAIRQLVSLGRAGRESANLKVRQPLARMEVAVPAGALGEYEAELLELLRDQVNVKSVGVVASDAELVRLKGKPNFRALGKRFGRQTPDVAKAVERLLPEQLRRLEQGEEVSLEVNGDRIHYLPGDLVVEREVVSDWLVESSGQCVAALDPVVPPELRREGLVRELVHRIQRLRKEAGYEYTTRIALSITGPREVLEAVRAHEAFIRGETLARELWVDTSPETPDLEREVDIDGTRAVVGLKAYATSTQAEARAKDI